MTSSNPKGMKAAIQEVIKSMMDRIMERVLVEDPFIKEKFRAEKPLYAALVPYEVFKGSHFERRFVTPFGSAWENLAVAAAQFGLGAGTRNHTVKGYIKSDRLRRIAEVLNKLEHGRQNREKIKPNWNKELEFILQGRGETIPVTVICDVYAENTETGETHAFELKAPLPNSDQTKVSKEKILKLHCMEPKLVNNAYFALPYNPYGKREDYDWSFPQRWFDMKKDKVVLIGDEFWEKIGGLGTYQVFIAAVNEIAPVYKDRIYREYLGIIPPEDLTNDIL